MKTIYLRQQKQYSPWTQRIVVVLSLIFTLIVSALLATNVWGLETQNDAIIDADLAVTGKVTIGDKDEGDVDKKTIINNDGTTQLADNVTILGQLRTPNQKGKKQTNGYTVLPSGVYIQWGVTQAGSQLIEHAFPIEFPNAAWVIVGMRNNQPDQGLQIAVKNNVSYELKVVAGTPQINWIAIGH